MTQQARTPPAPSTNDTHAGRAPKRPPPSLGDGDVVLGIETSCDDTAVALYEAGRGVVAHACVSQASSHSPYGGVVPELASRDHAAQLLGLVRDTVGDKAPDAVACTAGPGLPGCLAAGVSVAQSLAFAWGVPLAPVNHLEGHLLSPFLDHGDLGFPYLALLVSGGHTAIVAVRGTGRYEVLGQTLDDAAGEAFDKVGTMLGLGFPGGPELERLARSGDPNACAIPVAMRGKGGFDMSFSGLKTAARRHVADGRAHADIAAAFQQAAAQTMAAKVDGALAKTGIGALALVGGVGRNEALHEAMAEVAAARGARLFRPSPKWCTDNAAMIAYAGVGRMQRGYSVRIRPRWRLEEVS